VRNLPPPIIRFNFRSDGRRFGDSKRCLVPASALFEFTGTKYPKAKHRFTLNDAPFMAIAGLWREGQGNQPDTFTMLTTEPGSDVAPIHNRQVVVLRPEDWDAWACRASASRSVLAVPRTALYRCRAQARVRLPEAVTLILRLSFCGRLR